MKKYQVELVNNIHNVTDEEVAKELKGDVVDGKVVINNNLSELDIKGLEIFFDCSVEVTKIENKGDVKKMENKITLKGSDTIVSIIGLEDNDNKELALKAINALNENYILEDLIDSDNEVVVEVENEEYFNIGGNEYLVIEGYDNAYQRAVDSVMEIFGDCGISDNLYEIADQQGFIDSTWFEDAWKELHESQAYEEGLEYIITDEQQEQLDNKEITEDEIRENYFNSLQESIKGSEVEEFKFQFGEEYFNQKLKEEGIIDLEELAKYCVDADGIGHTLASYDFEEIEHNDTYMYRTN